MKLNKTYLIFIILVIFELCKFKEINRFEAVSLNGSYELSVTDFFRYSFLVSNLKGYDLIKCASKCAINKQCLLFTFRKEKRNECEFFSSMNFNSQVVSCKDSKIFHKYLDQNELSSTIQTLSNNNFNCQDNSNYFSIHQDKCVKCRHGWLGYKDICYKGFTDLKNWQEYVDYCSSLNSTLLIAQDKEKFEFFQKVSKNLTTISKNQRTWVNARCDSSGKYKWMNQESINTTFINPASLQYTGCYSFYTSPNSLLSVGSCSSNSNGICEYAEILNINNHEA